MGLLMLDVTYRSEITKDIGDELVSWNLEAMNTLNEIFLGFWLVDIFPFCECILRIFQLLAYTPFSTFHTELDSRCYLQVWVPLLVTR